MSIGLLDLNFSLINLNAIGLAIPEEKEVKNASQSELESFFNGLHNQLYKHSIIGQKALNDIINIMVMMQIDRLCRSGDLKIASVEGTDNNSDVYKVFHGQIGEYLVGFTDKFYTLLNTFNEIASIDPLLKSIYPNGIFLNVSNISLELVYDLCKKIYTFVNTKSMNEYDPQGVLYEKIINDYLGGGNGKKSSNSLGQFFTPRVLVDKIIDEVLDEVPDLSGSDEKLSVLDPFMGTGGFLTHAYKKLLERKISCELNGRDIEYDTFKYGLMNILVNTNNINFNNFHREDSIREPSIFNTDEKGQKTLLKYNVILTNPPFGLKFKLDEVGMNERKVFQDGSFKTIYEREAQQYARMPTVSGSMLALQLCMFMLDENGVCAIVMPRGQEMMGSSRNHKNFIQVRTHLVENHDLIKVLDCPKGSFQHTDVETCVLIFKHGKTSNVEFKRVLDNSVIIVSIDQLRARTYSFDSSIYKAAGVTASFSSGFEIKKLGELFSVHTKGKAKASDAQDEGKYLFFTSSLTPKYCDNPTFDKESLIIGSGGTANVNYASNFDTTADCFVLQDCKTQIKYIFHYLRNNLKLLQDHFTGMTIKHITKESLLNIEIPVPDQQMQSLLIDKFDRLEDQIKSVRVLQDNIEWDMKELANNYQPILNAETKKLGELCEVKQGEYITKVEEGKLYPLYGGGDISYYVDRYNNENEFIISKDGVSEKCVRYVGTKFFLNHHGWILINCKINKRYLGWYLYCNQDKIYNIASGAAQKGINQESIYNLDIPVSSNEDQLRFAQFCDSLMIQKNNLDILIQSVSYVRQSIISNQFHTQ